jgi:hypothetical protein
MLKDDGPAKEPLVKVAQRKWNNESIRRRIIQEKNRPKPRDVDAPPEPAEIITNDGRLDSSINRFERRFIKEIRSTLNEHQLLNLKILRAVIERGRYKLLKEKLRRLKVAQQSHGGSNND